MNTKDERREVSDYMDSLSERLYQIAYDNDWNLATLSIQSGISLRELYNIMYGRKGDIKLSTLAKISENLGEPIPSLIGIRKNPFEEHFKVLLQLHSDMGKYLKRSVSL